jgi:hypothetical protein
MASNLPDQTGIIDIISSAGCVRLLEPLLYRPGIEMYQSELIKETGVPLNRALKLLKLLVGQGILRETDKAGCKFYSASPENPVVRQLKVLDTTSKLYVVTRDFSSGDGMEVYLFGPAAKGEGSESTGIDVLIIANGGKDTVDRFLSRLKDGVRGEVRPVVYTSLGYANLYHNENIFYESIESCKIRLL